MVEYYSPTAHLVYSVPFPAISTLEGIVQKSDIKQTAIIDRYPSPKLRTEGSPVETHEKFLYTPENIIGAR